MLQKDIHADRVAVRKYKEISIAGYRINSSVSVAVLTDMVARYPRAYPFPAPAMLRLVDTSKTSLVLEHQPNPFASVENFIQFADSSVNFFEASTASWSALFGCLLLGSFFDHPCRCNTKYI